jgi:transcriptional regulator with XRE-family HTH domain
MKFAEKLQELRTKVGLSQSQLAHASGVPVWTLRGYEQGRREPLWYVLFRLASALGVSCEAFADCVSNQPAPAGELPKPKRGRPLKAREEEAMPAPKRPRGRPRKGK